MALPPEFQDTYRGYWALVQYAAGTKDDAGNYSFTSSDLLQAAAELTREAGQALGFVQSSQLLSLFSTARANFRAADTLASADPTTEITSRMIGEWPTAAPSMVFTAQPEYMAKGQFTYTNALGEQQTGWVTLTGINQLPPSVGNLQMRLQGAAMSQYSISPEEGGTPKTDAEVMTDFGAFTDVQIYAV